MREGGEAMRYFCIVGTVIHWLLLQFLLDLAAYLAGRDRTVFLL